jgi:hypothetical protein
VLKARICLKHRCVLLFPFLKKLILISIYRQTKIKGNGNYRTTRITQFFWTHHYMFYTNVPSPSSFKFTMTNSHQHHVHRTNGALRNHHHQYRQQRLRTMGLGVLIYYFFALLIHYDEQSLTPRTRTNASRNYHTIINTGDNGQLERV